MKEFKIVEFMRWKTSYEEVENFLMEKSSEGWDVVSMSVDVSQDIRGMIIVLLQRDR